MILNKQEIKSSLEKSKKKTNNKFFALGIGCFAVAIAATNTMIPGSEVSQILLPGVEPFSVNNINMFLTFVSLGAGGALSMVRGMKDTSVGEEEVNSFMTDKKRMDKLLNKLRKKEDGVNSKFKIGQ